MAKNQDNQLSEAEKDQRHAQKNEKHSSRA